MWASRWRTVEPGGPAGSSSSTAPSSYAMSAAYAASGLVTEASGKRCPVGPCVPATLPSARTTAAATVGTGQFSVIARLFMRDEPNYSVSRIAGSGVLAKPRDA